jgi:hypothetical protein
VADLITLAQAKLSLRTLPGFTADDADIGDLITSATAAMDDLCGPIITRACDETHDGGRPNVRLLQAPASRSRPWSSPTAPATAAR